MKTIKTIKEYKSLKMDKGFTIIKDLGFNKETFSQDIQRRTNITFSHIVQIVKELEERKLITKVLDGRIYKLNLTAKGNTLYNKILEIDKILE